MDNQQLYNLKNEQIQVLLTGVIGDGCIVNRGKENNNSYYSTNCTHKEYIEYKKSLLGNLALELKYLEKNGYSQKPIYTLTTKRSPSITTIGKMSIEEILELVNELGLALWIYDDGSLHKDKYFYNINTQSFDKETQEQLLIPFFNKWGIFPKLTIERKKDGREFYYLRVSKFEGSFEIASILSKYKIDCYNYKIWSSETIQKWSKLQEQLKSTNKTVSYKKQGMILNSIVL